MREKGIKLTVFYDDFGLTAQSNLECQHQTQMFVNYLIHLGFFISEKSHLEPSQQVTFLGLAFDTLRGVVQLPPTKQDNLGKRLRHWLRLRVWSLRTVQVICGHLNFASLAIPLGMLHLRPIQREIRSFKRQKHLKLPVPLPVKESLEWWRLHLQTSSPLFPPPHSVFLATDASDFGWGATIQGVQRHGVWSARQKRWSINRRELYTVWLICKEMALEWQNLSILLQTDNQTVVASLSRQGTTRSTTILDLSCRILVRLEELHIHMSVYHLPGRFNLLPDALSRSDVHPPEWHLTPAAARSYWHLLGQPTIDLFASSRSRQVYQYCSFDVTDHNALFIDAFSQPWSFKTAWVFPPPTEVPRVLSHLKTAQGQFYLVVPDWEGSWWYQDLRRLCPHGPHLIENLESNLVDLSTGRPPPLCQQINLAVWPICLGRASTPI